MSELSACFSISYFLNSSAIVLQISAALAGLLYAGRLASVRGDAAAGFELDIITMVLLGGVSVFGGRGTIIGVLFSILIVLNLRNGMALMNITGHIQTAVIGLLLIISVLGPNLAERVRFSGRVKTTI